MYRFWAGLMILCLCYGIVKASPECDYTVKISVIESHNYNAVFPAVVFVEELQKSFETDEKGNVVIANVCTGNYTFRIQAFSYHETVETATITGNTTLRFKMDHEPHMLQEVKVVDEHVKTILQTKESLNAKELAASSGKSLGDMLQSINGVSTLANGATIVKPVIHGMHSNRILILNNGIRQEDQQWGQEHAPNIDPFLANSITVIKGAAGVRYGTDAIGGVVLVEPATLRNKAGWAGELNLAGFSNNRMGAGSFMLEHGFKKLPGLSFRVQGTYKKGGNYRIPGYWVANTGVMEKDYSAALGYRKTHYGAEMYYSHFDNDLGVYRGAHTGNANDLLAAINSPVPLRTTDFTYTIDRPMQRMMHDLVKAKLYIDNRMGMWNVVYGYQRNYRQEYDVTRVATDKAQSNLALNTHSLNINLDHKPIGNITGQIGVDGAMQDNRMQKGDRLLIPAYNSLSGAAYLIERYKKDDWMVEAGVRYDNKRYEVFNFEGSNQHPVNYQFHYSNPSATIGVHHHLSDNWLWSATLAAAWRAPQVSELFSGGLHNAAARVEIGNKALVPEQSYGLNLETEYKLHDKLVADLSIYSQFINNYIYLKPGPNILTISGYFKSFAYTQTDAQLTGTDMTLKYQWSQYLDMTLKGAFLRAWDRTQKDWLIQMPADRLSLGAKYTRSISARLQECFAGVDMRYVLRQQRIPGNFDQIDYPHPPEGYFLVDASVGTRIQLNKQPLYISIAATNIFNIRYRDYMDVFRYFINQPGTNIALRIRVPFQTL